MIQKAILRAEDYQAEPIMQKFIQDMGLDDLEVRAEQPVKAEQRSVA
jgi:hypothetical protein